MFKVGGLAPAYNAAMPRPSTLSLVLSVALPLVLAAVCGRHSFGDELKHRFAVDRERTDEGEAFARGTTQPGDGTPDGPTRLYTSPWVLNEFPFNEVLVSWNVDLPEKCGFTVELRCARERVEEPTAWYHLGRFGNHPEVVRPHTRDENGTVAIDCFSATSWHQAYQYRLRLLAHGTAEPKLKRLTVIVSNQPGNPELHARFATPPPPVANAPLELKVPFRSQRAEDPAIQGRICSPTSVAMVLAYRGLEQPTSEVARRTFDTDHDIYGNWPANIQAAYSFGARGRIARFRSWDQARASIASGQPIIASIRDKQGALKQAPYATTDGHLLVITGFDAAGNVRVNDPAAADARRGIAVYDREAMEKVWLDQGGVAYLLGEK